MDENTTIDFSEFDSVEEAVAYAESKGDNKTWTQSLKNGAVIVGTGTGCAVFAAGVGYGIYRGVRAVTN
jgi:hypothetical protein